MKNQAFMLTPQSKNQKTGRIVVSTSCSTTCPAACPFSEGGGCYGEYGPVMMHWRRRNDCSFRADWIEFLSWLRALPEGSIFRHNQVGDLVGHANLLDGVAAAELVSATEHFSHRFTYTHYPVLADDADGNDLIANANRRVIEWMTSHGFIVNVSANSIHHAEAIMKTGIESPVVSAVDSDFVSNPVSCSSSGIPFMVCPAITQDEVTCKTCKLCMRPKRKNIIVFPAHGTGKKHADETVAAWDEKYRS